MAMKKPRPLDHSSAISIQVGPGSSGSVLLGRPLKPSVPLCSIAPSPRRTVLSLSLQSEPPGGPVRSQKSHEKLRNPTETPGQ